MPAIVRFSAHWGLALLIGSSLAACSSFDGFSNRVASVAKPYRADVVQGNFVSREQVEALQPGMSRQQVRDILGTSLVLSVFHADRWDYVFNLRRSGVEVQTRRLSVFFKGDVLERFEGDEMPTEAEFVSTLGARNSGRAAPVLEATEAQLARYPAQARDQNASPATEPAASPLRYPPLEPSVR